MSRKHVPPPARNPRPKGTQKGVDGGWRNTMNQPFVWGGKARTPWFDSRISKDEPVRPLFGKRGKS